MKKLAKVLIVDDEPHVLTYVSMLVRASLGELAISQARTAAEAIDLFTTVKPDLVLLDINLVGTSGLEALRAMMQIDPNAVVVMLSSVNIRRSIEQAQESGASGYLLKDMPHEELAAEIKNLVDELFRDEPSDIAASP